MSRIPTTRVKFTFLWTATTVPLSTTGAWSVLILAASDATGTGYKTIGSCSAMIESMSTFFNRYKVRSCEARFCGAVTSGVSETTVIKFVPEAITSAAESASWDNYVEGTREAWHLPGQTTVSQLNVDWSDLNRSGLPWKDANAANDELGAWGSLVLLTSYTSAETVRIAVTCELEFAELTDPDISSALAGFRGQLTPRHLLAVRAMTKPTLRDVVYVEEDDRRSQRSGDTPSGKIPAPAACMPPPRRFR